MYSLKDKVSKKLSHLFSDSPSPRSASHTDQSQARSSPKDGKPLSNILSFVLHPTSFDGFRSDKHEDDIRTIPSLPIRWKSRSFPRYGRPLDSREGCDPKYENVEALSSCEGDGSYESAKKAACENKETNKSHEKNDDRGSEKSTSCSEIFETASGPHSAERSVHNLTDNSLFITSNLYDFFQSSLPNIVKGCQWVLLYSTVRDGISLRTLLRKSADLSGPCLLITGDRQGAVFGGLLECPLKPTAKRKYQGTNQTFVFTTLYGEPRLFRPTGVNRYFYLCLTDLLAMGGGGNFALCLDADLLTGTSGPCETFGNLCLAHDEEFEMKNVELWGFTHSSRYLT